MSEPRSAVLDVAAPLSVGDLRALVDGLADVPVAGTDAERIDQLNALERIKSAAAAAQAAVTCEVAESQTERARSSAAARGLAACRLNPDAGIGSQIGLARQESPHAGRQHLNLARALLGDLPHTFAALARGDISERRAQIMATETGELTRSQRLGVDAELASELHELGDVKLMHAVRRIVMRIDEEGVLRRRKAAHARRRVSSRSLGDGMAQVSAIVSGVDASAIMFSLWDFADRRQAQEDRLAEERTRGQLITDIFVGRLTGRSASEAAPVALKLVLSAETLLGDDATPGHLDGVGPIPATICRELVRDAFDTVRSSIQRLFRMPDTDALVALERASRGFPPALHAFLTIRDQLCRTRWCNARVRHGDHVRSWRAGGPTTVHNGQGLCEACNYAKDSPGWRQRTTSTGLEPHTVETTTPTGHRYRSREPGLPRPAPETPGASTVELYYTDLVLAV